MLGFSEELDRFKGHLFRLKWDGVLRGCVVCGWVGMGWKMCLRCSGVMLRGTVEGRVAA